MWNVWRWDHWVVLEKNTYICLQVYHFLEQPPFQRSWLLCDMTNWAKRCSLIIPSCCPVQEALVLSPHSGFFFPGFNKAITSLKYNESCLSRQVGYLLWSGCLIIEFSTLDVWITLWKMNVEGVPQGSGQPGSSSWGPDCSVSEMSQTDLALAGSRDSQVKKRSWFAGLLDGQLDWFFAKHLSWIHPITRCTVRGVLKQ